MYTPVIEGTVHLLHTVGAPDPWGQEQKHPFTRTGPPSAWCSEATAVSQALLHVFTAHSSPHAKVAAGDAGGVRCHSFFDCSIVPKFGVLRSHRIPQHPQRQPKGMSFQNKSQHLSDESDPTINTPIRISEND